MPPLRALDKKSNRCEKLPFELLVKGVKDTPKHYRLLLLPLVVSIEIESKYSDSQVFGLQKYESKSSQKFINKYNDNIKGDICNYRMLKTQNSRKDTEDNHKTMWTTAVKESQILLSMSKSHQ